MASALLGERVPVALGKTFICKNCGTKFRSAQFKAVYCSPVCRNAGVSAVLKARSAPKPPHVCRQCGAEFRPYNLSGSQRKAGHVQRFCSRKCRADSMSKYASKADAKKAYWRRRSAKKAPVACLQCEAEFLSRHGAKCCSEVCKQQRYKELRLRRYVPASSPSGPRPCRWCGSVFIPEVVRHGRRLFCSHECGKHYHKQGGNHRHRARFHGVSYEPIDPIKVFNRDGWRCQICGVRTPRSLRGTGKPTSPELDHRIPMAMGGGHLWSNVQCTCRACNGAKGGKRVLGQMALFDGPVGG
jgi:hypothetical protein